MRTPAPEIRERLYGMAAPEFAKAARMFANLRTAADRAAAIQDAMKTAYLLGLDRGYDMAADVYDDGGPSL